MNENKLQQLADDWGMEVMDMLSQATFDSISPGICMNAGCDYSTDVEPDQDAGWCEICYEGSVKSALILAGVI